MSQINNEQMQMAATKSMLAEKAMLEAKSRTKFDFFVSATILNILPGQTKTTTVIMPSDGDFETIGFNIAFVCADGAPIDKNPLLEMRDDYRGRPLQNVPILVPCIATPGDIAKNLPRFGMHPFKYYFNRNSSFQMSVQNQSAVDTIERFALTWYGIKRLYSNMG